MENIDNLELFIFSLKNPEPIVDDFYLKNGNLIISRDIKRPTEVMRKNSDLIESISAYNFAKKNKNRSIEKKAIETILKIVKSKDINYSEFVSFWPVVDISYSLFSELSEDEQTKIIKSIVDKYIELRHDLYSLYGYTPTTLQVSKDAKTHKQGGNLGINKISEFLGKAGFKKANFETIEDFFRGRKKYIEADKTGKKLFRSLLVHNKIKFSWSKKKEQKMPDFLIRCKNHIFIVEHKHKKEGGGGQNSQINELISLISFRENDPKIHFVSFLDGVYFNQFTSKEHRRKSKVPTQLANIIKNLKRNKQNYFVNMAGFKKLLGKL